MDRLKEIESRKEEIKSQVNALTDLEEIRKLKDEVDKLNLEEKDLRVKLEENKIASAINETKLDVKNIYPGHGPIVEGNGKEHIKMSYSFL